MCDIFTGTLHTVFSFCSFALLHKISNCQHLSAKRRKTVEFIQHHLRQALTPFIHKVSVLTQSCRTICGPVGPEPWDPLKEWCHSFILLLNHGLVLWIYRIELYHWEPRLLSTFHIHWYHHNTVCLIVCVFVCECVRLDTPAINLLDNAANGQCIAPDGATDLLSSLLLTFQTVLKKVVNVCVCVWGLREPYCLCFCNMVQLLDVTGAWGGPWRYWPMT